MRALVVGAGIVGSICAIGLARQGFSVELIDRDPGPVGEAEWRRRGVMQFQQPHVFRKNFHEFFKATAPDVWDSLLSAGCIPAPLPGQGSPGLVALQTRRETVERVLRTSVEREPGVALVIGHADEVIADSGRVRGVIVDGARHDAEVVIVASGRASHLGDVFRPAGRMVRCGVSYVSRQYRALPGHDVPVSAWPFASRGNGYLSAVFPQDDGQLSLLVLRPVGDPEFASLRSGEVFDRFARAVPNLAPWADPARFTPLSDPMPGPELSNTYRDQVIMDGHVTAAGLFFVGDAVMATNPSMGRGAATGAQQASELLRILGEPQIDLAQAVMRLEEFNRAHMRPWFLDQLSTDASFLRDVSGQEIDPDGPISSDLVEQVLEELPEVQSAAFAYMDMDAMPAALDPYREGVRAKLKSGWRPRLPDGPTREQVRHILGELSGR